MFSLLINIIEETRKNLLREGKDKGNYKDLHNLYFSGASQQFP